jgi:hypothetical protein
MNDLPAVAVPERQIPMFHQLRRQSQEDETVQPRSLLKAPVEWDLISQKDIRDIVQAQYVSPVVSLYLSLTAEKLVPRGKGLVRVFRSLKTREYQKRQSFISSLSRRQQTRLDRDMEEIETFLENLVPMELGATIIFKCGEDLNRVLALPVHTSDSLVIDADPYVVPLEAVIEQNERVLFVEVSKRESRFLICHMGYCQEVDRIRSFVPSDSVDASIPGKAQRHRLTHLQWHLKETARHIYRLSNEHAYHALVLMGEERVEHMLEEFLHESLKPKIISRIYSAPAADPRDRKGLIESALREYKATREKNAIQELTQHKPAEVVSGLRCVIDAGNLFQIRKLVVNANLKQAGFVCKQHHFLSLEAGDCPFCGNQLLPVENVIDELIEVARLHGVTITLVEYSQDLLAKYDGIAALVYNSLPSQA